jgi:hypothetical protein
MHINIRGLHHDIAERLPIVQFEVICPPKILVRFLSSHIIQKYPEATQRDYVRNF